MVEKKAYNRLKTTREIGQMVTQYYDDLNQAHQDGRLVAWCFGSPPSLILRAANIAYLWGNQYGAAASARGIEKGLHDVAEKEGYSRSVCSYFRSNMGTSLITRGAVAIEDANPYYMTPVPDFIVSLNPHCHNSLYWMDALRRQFNCPAFYFEIPHEWEYTGAEFQEAVAITLKQHRDFITFIEDISHRKFDWDLLTRLMVEAKEAGLARAAAMELSKNIPSPATYFDWLNSLAPVNLLAGAPGTAAVMQKMVTEIRERADNHEGAILNEKYRLYYDGLGPYPVLGQVSRGIAAMGANVVCGRYLNLGFFSDPDKFDPNHPLETMSAGLYSDYQLNWSFDHLVEGVCQLCREFAVDGLIFQVPKTCRSTSNREIELMEVVSRRLDLPVALMEGDQTDRSFYDVDRMFAEIETMLAAIDARRARVIS